MPGLRQFRALHRPEYDLITTHIRNALRDHPAPEDFLAILVLDTSLQAPPLGVIIHPLLQTDALRPPLRVCAAMLPLLVEGVRSESAQHHRIDRLPRVSAFFTLVARYLPQLELEVRRWAGALLPISASFAQGPQRAMAHAVTSQLTHLLSDGTSSHRGRPPTARRAA